MKKLSVIISNRNDTAMLSVTVASCIEELKPLGLSNCEIVICDNSDFHIYKRLGSFLPTGYVRDKLLKVARQDFPCLFSARETAIKHSSGKYLACLDSHMLSGRDMFLDLYNFMESKKEDKTLGFAHAPINWAHHHQRYAKHDRDMSVNELGNWNLRYKSPTTVTWKGMPWICRRTLWDEIGGYGALAENKVSWGGGDILIGIKPWLLGFKNWAVPCSAGIHIGPFPKINTPTDKSHQITENFDEYRYRLYANSGNGPHAIGYLIACYVLGGEPMMIRNAPTIKERFGNYINVEKQWEKAIELGKAERQWLCERQTITFDQLLQRRPWES